jgi:hypothetical protein
LNVSPETVFREWSLAKDWVLRELQGEQPMKPERWREIERLYHEALVT